MQQLDGLLYNPLYQGEGISIHENDEGGVSGFWFTYIDGKQAWILFKGSRDGFVVRCDAYITHGGNAGSLSNPDDVVVEEWGSLTFHQDNLSLSFSFEGKGASGGYELQWLFDGSNDSALAVIPKPAHKLEEYFANEWASRPTPFTGQRVINKEFFSDPGYFTTVQLKLTAEDADLTITDVDASEETGVCKPIIEGVSRGQVLRKGEHAIIRLRSRLTGGARCYPRYRIEVDEKEVVNIEVRLSTQYRGK